MSLVDLRPALRAFLLADTAVAAMASSRVFPGVLPQGETRPSLVYQEVSSVGDHHTGGASGLARSRMQITAWAPTQDAAAELALLAKARLDGSFGTWSGVVVQGVFFDGSQDLEDTDARLRGRALDFLIWYAER